ncbi:hypothetical protein AeMF1_020515 [Aphanomyces euteiches]|nr:hypothetical protein AeMF1_020515 [Aphanomyces euteiches]
MESSVEIVKTRRRYSLDTKRNILRALTECTQKDVSSRSGIPLRTIQNFVREKDKIIASLRAKRCRNIGYSGRKEILPGLIGLYDCHEAIFPLTTYHVVQQVKANHQDWVTAYSALKVDPYESLFNLCRDFVYRHGFSRRRASTAKSLDPQQMHNVREKFLSEFWLEHGEFEDSEVINCDETGIYFDTPPRYILTQKGSDASIAHGDKSCRLTAVLAARRNGEKLPIMFVLKGKPGGYIDTNELYLYPPEHLYAVQQNAWIDGDNVLRPEIIKPSLIVIDNFDAHTTAKKTLPSSKKSSVLSSTWE